MGEYRIDHPQEGLWVIWDNSINIYLIAGEKKAVLLDTGFGWFDNLRKTCEQLCGLPVELYHTHVHGDHTGGDGEWEEAWLNPIDWEAYRADRGNNIKLLPLEEGMVIDLGGRELEVYHIPGHSAGSMAFLDRKNRILFPGDTVMRQPVFLFAPDASAEAFLSSLEKLQALDAFDTVYPCHEKWPLDPKEAIPALMDCARQAIAGDPAGLTTLQIDLGVAVASFEGYGCGGYGVATRPLDGPDGPADK